MGGAAGSKARVGIFDYAIAYQVQLTELYADAEQDGPDVGERHKRGQMVADDDLVVVLGSRGRGGQKHGAAQRVRDQVQSLVARAVAHEIDHGRYVVVRPFVNAAKAKYFAVLYYYY